MLIKKRYLKEPLVIAGTSAGAMVMSNIMIYDGDAQKAHLKGEIKFSTGFGFITNIIVDTYFEKRGRFNRLAQAVAVQPEVLDTTGRLVPNLIHSCAFEWRAVRLDTSLKIFTLAAICFSCRL